MTEQFRSCTSMCDLSSSQAWWLPQRAVLDVNECTLLIERSTSISFNMWSTGRYYNDTLTELSAMIQQQTPRKEVIGNDFFNT
jgi:hypothetical protein